MDELMSLQLLKFNQRDLNAILELLQKTSVPLSAGAKVKLASMLQTVAMRSANIKEQMQHDEERTRTLQLQLEEPPAKRCRLEDDLVEELKKDW